ncbi:hypothetical protein IGI04_005371 [Brassica rapa subsp. trilocularis]|nr:hypothetical protein IGI04_005371 [Brassica rapa subsp. trilocularis]
MGLSLKQKLVLLQVTSNTLSSYRDPTLVNCLKMFRQAHQRSSTHYLWRCGYCIYRQTNDVAPRVTFVWHSLHPMNLENTISPVMHSKLATYALCLTHGSTSSKESAEVAENAFLLPNTSPPLMLIPQESSVKLFFFLHLFITLKLSSSSLNSHVTLTTYRNHRSVLTSANAIILDPPLNSHVSLTSSWNHRSKSTVGSSSKPVSSSPSDQNYGFSHELESKSVDIKALNRVDSEDPSISDNSSPVLVETAKIRANSPKIARRKTKGRTSYTSKRKGNSESIAIVLTSVDPERDFRESMVEMIVENKMKEQTDLEDLLACYLSLNSSEYHDIIIKAFEKTWFHLTHLT